MSISDWQINNSWTLFLDRDGVINERIFGGYITQVNEFNFTKGAVEAIVALSSIFNRIVVVTNQQGIAKGLMSERNLLDIHDYMCEEIKLAGGHIDACFFASNLKGAGSDRRKPDPAMAIEAKEIFSDIDFSRSIMVGDTDSDIRFGRNLGMKTVLVRSEEKVSEKADIEVDSLLEFEKLIRNEKPV